MLVSIKEIIKHEVSYNPKYLGCKGEGIFVDLDGNAFVQLLDGPRIPMYGKRVFDLVSRAISE